MRKETPKPKSLGDKLRKALTDAGRGLEFGLDSAAEVVVVAAETIGGAVEQ